MQDSGFPHMARLVTLNWKDVKVGEQLMLFHPCFNIPVRYVK